MFVLIWEELRPGRSRCTGDVVAWRLLKGVVAVKQSRREVVCFHDGPFVRACVEPAPTWRYGVFGESRLFLRALIGGIDQAL